MSSVVLDNAVLLNRYYDRRAESSLPTKAAFFQFGQVQWADDLIETVEGKPSVKPIPKTLESLNGVFHTNDAVYTYSNGEILVRATIQPNEISGDNSHQFSALGILDEAGGLIAVAATQPVYVYSARGLVVEVRIKTNIS